MVEKNLTPARFNEAGDILAAFWYQSSTRHFRSGGHLYAELYNGIKMPLIGFGTFKISGHIADEAICNAIDCGYLHIDTATRYNNEGAVGEGIKLSKINREDLFITTKLPIENQSYSNTIKEFLASIERLDVDYVDLYLIHAPTEGSVNAWKAMEYLYTNGLARAIGISNFDIQHIEGLLDRAEVIPMVNQIEFHPCSQQLKLKDYCDKIHIQIESYSPLMQGKILKIPELINISEKHSRSVAQIALRWCIQQQIPAIPKTSSIERMKSNLKIFDFSLDDKDMEVISLLQSTAYL